MDFIHDKVFINSVFPSTTLTPILQNNFSQDYISDIENGTPLKTLASTLDTARAIEFLISKENNYITGSGIDISGGLFLNG